MMINQYLDGNIREAEVTAMISYDIDKPYASANQGYVVMMAGHLDVAADILAEAMKNPKHKTLASYDLGIVKLKEGKIGEGESLLREVMRYDDMDAEPYEKLVIASYGQQHLVFEERDKVLMRDSCTETINAIEQMRAAPDW